MGVVVVVSCASALLCVMGLIEMAEVAREERKAIYTDLYSFARG